MKKIKIIKGINLKGAADQDREKKKREIHHLIPDQ
jgi:hypothetical protein